jgi:DNA-binding LacI/PurR family transcriptional regulator
MLKTTRKSVKLQDVAALAGIDMATASRALNGKGHVSSATRDVALKAAQELGYQPDAFAQRLASGRSHNVIGLLPFNDLGVLTKQAFFIEHRLDELDYEVQIHNVPQWVSHFEDRQIALVNKVRRQRPGAIISGSPLVPKAIEELQFFIQEGGVVVGYAEKMELDCDQVPFDSLHRAYLAARHLLELGHRELGICFHGSVQQDLPELEGFSRAMKEFGAPVQNDWIFGGGNYEDGGARLAQAFLSWPKKPTGMCIVNDVSASVFVTSLARNGVSVPDDVSVVGFDDALIAQHALVPLTSVSYPLEAIGRHVVEFAQSRLKGYNGPPRMVVVQSELITRSSTAPYCRSGRSQTGFSTASPSAPTVSLAS